MEKPVIAVHGGAGAWSKDRSQAGFEGVKAAAKIGFDCMNGGGSAVDAVEASVASMEDSAAFNAGLGSALTIDKRIEMEASIMDGKTLCAGATGLLRDIKNPVSLARITMENTDHVFVVGEGAEKLAKLFKVPRKDPLTEMRLNSWRELTAKLRESGIDNLPKLKELVAKHPGLFQMDTVGAVALDREGNTAAATSTGGFTLKLPGRIGDSPLIGCGNYADNEAGACSATGIGEIAIRLVLAKHVIDQMRGHKSAQRAVNDAILLVNRRIGTKNSMGLVAVDMQGRIGAAHNTQNIAWAYMTPKMKEPKADLKAKQILVETDAT